MPTTWTYVKKSGAPSGTISITLASGTYVIDDSTNPSIVTSDSNVAASLGQNQYLTLQGTAGTYTPPPVIQDVFLADGVLASGNRTSPTSVGGSPQGGSLFRGSPVVATGGRAAYAPSGSAATAISDGTVTTEMTRMRMVATCDCTDLRVIYGNYSWNVAGTNAYTVTAGIEKGDASETIPVFFAGGKLAGVPDINGRIVSEPVPMALKKGDVFFVRSYVVVTSGQKFPHASFLTQSLGEYIARTAGAGSDKTQLTGAFTPSSGSDGNAAFAPACVIGTTTAKQVTVGGIGDSITVGLGDTSTLNVEPHGWFERACSGNFGYANLAKFGEQASDVTVAGSLVRQNRWPYLSGCTHAVEAYGSNDFGGGAALATVQANKISIWRDCVARSVKVWAATVIPRTTSTDSWATTANQTPLANDAARIAFNGWLRDGAPILNGVAVATGSSAVGTVRIGQSGHPLLGYLELADAVESARDSGKFKVGSTTDGVHPSSQGATDMATAAALASRFIA